MLHYIKILTILLSVCALVLVLNACNQHKAIENDLIDYTERLSSFTEIEVELVTSNLVLPTVNKALIKNNIPEVTINLREFYAFNDCSLSQLVAQRNTALGKMQLPSSRFVYEIDLINALKLCITSLEKQKGKEKLIQKLQNWLAIKKSNLPKTWANLITQSTEIISHISGTDGFITGDSSDNLYATKQALRFLLDSFNKHPVDITLLELHLNELSHAPLLARKWQTQKLLSVHLNNVSTLLHSFLAENTCSTPKQKKDIEIMRNIFTQFFANKIQSLASQLNKYHYQLSPLISELIEHENLPGSFKDYLNIHSRKGFDNYAKSMQSHIALWQKVFARCN